MVQHSRIPSMAGTIIAAIGILMCLWSLLPISLASDGLFWSGIAVFFLGFALRLMAGKRRSVE